MPLPVTPHSKHHFPAPSSKLCQTGYITEEALSISVQLTVHWLFQRPPKGLGTNKTGSNSVKTCMHVHDVNMRRIRAGLKKMKKKEFRLNYQTILVLFVPA